jgi:23S rRNA pseudouridine2605 synthase
MRNDKPGQPKPGAKPRPHGKSRGNTEGKSSGKPPRGSNRFQPRAAPGRDNPNRDSAAAGGKPAFSRPNRSKLPRPIEGAPREPMRIAKAMARAGLCSRRDAERWIEDGRVVVNNQVIKSPALDVGPRDRVKVDGVELPSAGAVKLWRYYKPKGTVTTHRDPEGRPTVFEKLPEDMPRVISIGRLDFNTEGLLLLTNDGDLARFIELPATGWLRRYRVRAMGSVTQEQLDGLKDGIEIEGVRYGPVEATLDSAKGSNVWLTIGLREGKNREVRKILGSLMLEVNRLIRISFGPFQLMDMEEGKIEQVKRRVLADQLGPELTKQFGLDMAPEDEGGKSVRNSGYRARPIAPKAEGERNGEREGGPKPRKRADKHDSKGERAAPRRFADRKPQIGADPRPGSANGGSANGGSANGGSVKGGSAKGGGGADPKPRDKSRGKPGNDGASANALAIRKALSGRDDGDEPRGKSSRPPGKPSTGKLSSGKPGRTRPMKPR